MMPDFLKPDAPRRISHYLVGCILICLLTLGLRCNGAPSGESVSPTTGPTPYDRGSAESIQDIDRDVGFRVSLPSYIPETIDPGYSVMRTSEKDDPRYEAVTVTFLHRKDTFPYAIISIREQRPEPGQTFDLLLPDEEISQVNQLEVHCTVGGANATSPEFLCVWNAGELSFAAYFDWILPAALPGGITSEMHDEAMKVVQSMIEDPYIP